MLHKEWDPDVDEAVKAEAQAPAICMQTVQFAEAYQACVVDTRSPRFQGR